MSINIRTLLSKTVSAIKEKLGINSFTWGEFETKLNEAVNGADEFSKAFFEEGLMYVSTDLTGHDKQNLAVPEGITKICQGRFKEAKFLKTITFSSTINLIEADAFKDCGCLETLNFSKHTSVPKLADSSALAGAGYLTDVTYEIRVPNALLEQWKAADVWKNYADKIVGV